MFGFREVVKNIAEKAVKQATETYYCSIDQIIKDRIDCLIHNRMHLLAEAEINRQTNSQKFYEEIVHNLNNMQLKSGDIK